MKEKNLIVIVGPRPRGGISTGVAKTMDKFSLLLTHKKIPHLFFDVGSPYAQKTWRHHGVRLRRYLWAFLRVLFAPRRPRRSYLVNLDGGAGLAYNAMILAAIRLRRGRIFLYHHSTSYIVANPDPNMQALIDAVRALESAGEHVFA